MVMVMVMVMTMVMVMMCVPLLAYDMQFCLENIDAVQVDSKCFPGQACGYLGFESHELEVECTLTISTVRLNPW